MIESKKEPQGSLREEIVNAIRATGDVATAVIETIGRTFASTVRSAADVTGDVIDGARQIGSDLGQAAKGLVIGMIRGSKHTGEAALSTMRNVARSVVQHTSQVGGDVGVAAKGAVQGAIQGAKEMGLDAVKAASEAAQGALDAAEETGASAGRKVRDAFKGAIDGIKVILKEPFKSKGSK